MERAIRKIDILNVRTLEEEIYLIQEGERDYKENGAIDAKEAYLEGLKFINNLKM